MENNKICLVTNRSSGTLIYSVDDLNRRRVFSPNETKKIPVEELEMLVQQPGGMGLFYNFLQIQDLATVQDIINGKPDPEPEYWLTEEKIPEWMQTCTLDEFKDALDFAPLGVKDLIKKYAVSLPLSDINKRQAILDQLNYDVEAAIKNSGEDNTTTKKETAAVTPQGKTRRVIRTGA